MAQQDSSHFRERTRKWARFIAVASLYIAFYIALRPLTHGIWSLTTGLRLSVLFFFPYRDWPALAVGELIPLAAVQSVFVPHFGLTWTILTSIPPMLFAMPIVWLFRTRMGMFPSKKSINFTSLISCVLCVSLLWVLIVQAIDTTANVVQDQSLHALVKQIGAALIGRYAGILTILPLVMMVRLDNRPIAEQFQWRTIVKSPLTMDTVIILLPILICLAAINRHASSDGRDVIHIMMWIPVAWMTIKHGWRGAAVGSAVVMGCVLINTQSRPDINVIQLQAFVAFISTALLALGANVVTQREIDERNRVDVQEAMKAAQKGLYQTEMRMKHIALALEQVGVALQLHQTRLFGRFKHILSQSESMIFHKQAAETQSEIYRLANSIHPVAWRDNGLPIVLRQTVARALDEAGVAYSCDLSGNLSDLSHSVHVAIYRMINEVIVYACDLKKCTTIDLCVRGGYTNGRRWVMMRVTGTVEQHHEHINDPIYKIDDRVSMAHKLGAHGLQLGEMRDCVRLYNGDMHVRASPRNVRITSLFHDAQKMREAPRAPAFKRQLLLR